MWMATLVCMRVSEVHVIGDGGSSPVDLWSLAYIGMKPATNKSHPVVDFSESVAWFTAPKGIHLGNIAGVDTDSKGNVIFFHRGEHGWDGTTFTLNNEYKGKSGPAIKEPTLIRMDASGQIQNPVNDMWGRDM